MDCTSCAAAFAANQVTQISESNGSFSVAAYALSKAQTASESAVLPLIEKLPEMGGYNAQGNPSSSSTSGSQLNLQG